MNIGNFDGFSKILTKIVNFTDPAPQKLLRINTLKIFMKKSSFQHTYFNGQTAIYMSKIFLFPGRPGVDPGTEIFFYI